MGGLAHAELHFVLTLELFGVWKIWSITLNVGSPHSHVALPGGQNLFGGRGREGLSQE